MISLRSEIFPDFFLKKVDYSSKVMFVGSCFSDNIGQKLEKAKIPCQRNPFGVLYNPASVSSAISSMIENKAFVADDLVFFNEKWISFSHHGIFSGTDKDEVLAKINNTINSANAFLRNASVLFVTFGTAWVYELLKTKKIVANCHKVPAKEFKHFLLQTDEIVANYEQLLKKIREFNPHLEVVFTVSPVRHWKDGAVNNQLSKSTLFVAVHKLVEKYEFAHYFPSYEILMDDLRDYRFYADDLFHPNQMAIDYIWEKFCTTYFDNNTIDTLKKIEKLQKNIDHRVFYPKTEAYKKFISSNLKLIENLKINFPAINFESEYKHFFDEAKRYWPKEF
jgi:hypothetical protein